MSYKTISRVNLFTDKTFMHLHEYLTASDEARYGEIIKQEKSITDSIIKYYGFEGLMHKDHKYWFGYEKHQTDTFCVYLTDYLNCMSKQGYHFRNITLAVESDVFSITSVKFQRKMCKHYVYDCSQEVQDFDAIYITQLKEALVYVYKLSSVTY